MDFEDGTGSRPFDDGGDAFRIHVDAVRRYDETKEVDLLDVELAFLEFDVETVLLE